MISLHVVVGHKPNGDESIEEFKGTDIQFHTEPSGVLLILESANRVWKAYAPGAWETVTRHAD